MHESAAVIAYLSPGLRFFHQGQLEGRKTRIPVQLNRAPHEPTDEALKRFYKRLLAVLRQPAVREGRWQPLDCVPASEGNETWDSFIAWAWEGKGKERCVIAVNYAVHPSQCYVRYPFADGGGRAIRLKDLMSDACYDRDGNDLLSRGLYLDLPPWSYHVFEVNTP